MNISNNVLRAYTQMLAGISNLKVSIGGKKAYSTKDGIQLPAIPLSSESGLAMSTGYAMHEEGHINDTNFDLWPSDPVLARWTNTFEDIRIEARQMVRFPGAKRRLAALMELVIAEGGFPAPSAKASPNMLVSQYVLYRLRAEVLGQTSLLGFAQQAEALVRDAIPPGAMARLTAMMFQVEKAQNTQDCIDLARAVLDMLQEEQEKAEEEAQSSLDGQDQQPTQGDDSDQQQGGDGDSDDSDADSDGSSGGGDQEDQQGSNTAGGPDAGDSSPDNEGEGASGGAPAVDADQGSLGQQADNLKRMLSGEDNSSVGDLGRMVEDMLERVASEDPASAVNFPKAINFPGEIGDPALILERVGSATRALKRRVMNLLEGVDREKVFHRSTGGRLDMRRIPQLVTGGINVFAHRIEGIDINTAVQVLIDRSTSMQVGKRIEVACDAALALTYGMEGVQGVSVSTVAFPYRGKEMDDSVAVVSDFGERAAAVAPRFAAMTADGCTPMAEALLHCGCRLMNRKEDRKILFVVTDGQPEAYGETSSVSASKARYVLQELEKAGIEVIAVGIKIDVSLLFGNSRKVDELDELPEAVFGMLQSQLLGQRKAA